MTVVFVVPTDDRTIVVEPIRKSWLNCIERQVERINIGAGEQKNRHGNDFVDD